MRTKASVTSITISCLTSRVIRTRAAYTEILKWEPICSGERRQAVREDRQYSQPRSQGFTLPSWQGREKPWE